MDEVKNLEDGSRVFVSNLVGCESTELEGLRVLQYLALNGHTITESPREADFIVVNTCRSPSSARRPSMQGQWIP